MKKIILSKSELNNSVKKIMNRVKKLNTPEKRLEEATRLIVKYTLLANYPGAYNQEEFDNNFKKEYPKIVQEENRQIPKESMLRHFGRTQDKATYNLMRLLAEDKSPASEKITKSQFNEIYPGVVLYSHAVKMAEYFVNYKLDERVGKTFDIFFQSSNWNKGLEGTI